MTSSPTHSLPKTDLILDTATRKFVPKKHWGQNFLIDPNITQKIISACELKKKDVVLEIGPGKGALTKAMAPHVERLIAVEADQELAQNLKKHFDGSRVAIIHQDILRFNFNELSEKIKVIGNLPYYISSQIIAMILSRRDQITESFLTLQLEFAQRLCAQSNTKSYGALSCFVQYYADPQILFKISNSCFQPIPKVQSCFLKLKIRLKPLYTVRDEKFLFQLIRLAFGQRRKTILNSLSSLGEKEIVQSVLEKLRLNPELRAENLGLEDYVRIAENLKN